MSLTLTLTLTLRRKQNKKRHRQLNCPIRWIWGAPPKRRERKTWRPSCWTW